MKREIKICFLYALLYSLPFLFYVFLLLLFSLPVHAAESSPSDLYTFKWGTDYYCENFYDREYSFSITVPYKNVFAACNNYASDNKAYVLAYYDSAAQKIVQFTDYKKYTSWEYICVDNLDDTYSGAYSNDVTHYSNGFNEGYQNYSGHQVLCTWHAEFPVFKSWNDAINFYKNNDTSGLLNGGSIDNPDFQDTAYAFTGFTANNKMSASWTGTTERTYLQDQEVEEYVRVNYYFADKEAQDTIKQADAYPDEFATADKTLTIDVSDLKPDDENWFLRYIRITPCYRQAGLGAWGDFYHGETSYVYFNQDGSIDRIDAPYIKGELSTDMERPVIVLHEAANGNPTESDYSYFEFNNAQSDYFFEMKGRWYTTNDFDLYRDKLVWKYKYSTLLKNNLSTWVSVSDNRSSVGRFQFDVLGKSSWDNLLSSYPVDDRNYIGGSYNLFNKITGYSDALETLKMLLKQPYSLFNGYEVYVRYFRYDENGGIQYSKWTHFYNNLADSDGSSGSRLDDLDNMYSENQSDKGLTDDELSDLENGGNSRNDLDAVPKNNYDYSSLENATMNFFDLLKNFGTMLGQFPSMVAAVFGFLPPWLIGLIGVAIGAVIVCRFIGR